MTRKEICCDHRAEKAKCLILQNLMAESEVQGKGNSGPGSS